MFAITPGLLKDTSEDEWILPSMNQDEDIVIDTHFMGMTPMNDVDASHHSSE
jgi:hypothetical protein